MEKISVRRRVYATVMTSLVFAASLYTAQKAAADVEQIKENPDPDSPVEMYISTIVNDEQVEAVVDVLTNPVEFRYVTKAELTEELTDDSSTEE